MEKISIRQENANDYNAIRNLVHQAFLSAEHSGGNEADLVDKLRRDVAYIPELSLVAIAYEQAIGHIMFSKASVGDTPTLAMAPVSVLPEFQNQGIGSLLINTGLELARKQGYLSAIVLGSSGYYPRFGFRPASKWGIMAPFEVPDENFMALELQCDSLLGASGTVRYSDAFGA